MPKTGYIAMLFAQDVSRASCRLPVRYAYQKTVLKTTMTRNLQSDEHLLADTNKAHPFGGMGEVEDVAQAAVFLASARWVTGVPLPVDGGYLTL